ncbi:MAG TPA: GNAT family N-acetyltransferase [Flavisolibacter sp.]|nr:GNAT family N-acetyltransferase [Flavisolibacter sp.]
MEILIRQGKQSDSYEIWQLMRELAIFEHYIDSFAITPAIVAEKGYQKNPPDFYCLVAEDRISKTIVGIAVYYFHPFTALNKPALYMKELYVREEYRKAGVGKSLMEAVIEEATRNQCCSIKWMVAPWNAKGIRFYERLGAKENKEWLQYEIVVS